MYHRQRYLPMAPTLELLAEQVEPTRRDLLAYLRYGPCLDIPDQETYQQAKRHLRRCLLAARCTRRPLPLPDTRTGAGRR